MAFTTFTLGGNNLNDGSTYTVEGDTLVIESLQTTWDEYTNYASGATSQVNVKTGQAAHVTFSLIVQAASSAALNTAVTNLFGWVAAGGTLVIADGGTTILNCTVGVQSAPQRNVSQASLLNHWTVVDVDLERLT